MTEFLHPPQSHPPELRPRRWIRAVLIAVLVGAGMWTASQLGGASFTVVRGMPRGDRGSDGTAQLAPKLPKLDDDPEYAVPNNDKSRLDILLLGVRGQGDSVNGGLLTDTILLFSLDTRNGRASMTSIPRDLTVRVNDEKTEKINAAYVNNGIAGTKKLFSRILGIGVDNVVVVDFAAFSHIVDTIGGITITLDKPFTESQQWADGESEYVFSLPAGSNTLDGQSALYYVRSRYSSSDFDRARRQQQVLLAIKAKVEGLNLLSDPIRAVQLMTTIRKHIESDLDIFDLGTIRELIAQGGQMDRIRRYQLTTENLLYEDKINGVYELLPRGATLSHIKEFFRTVLDDAPVIAAPTLTPSAPAEPTPEASPTQATP